MQTGNVAVSQDSRLAVVIVPYPQMKEGCLQGNLINLPMFGKVKVILHRPIPDGFKIASVTKKADGYYLTLSLEDTSVPTIKPTLIQSQ